MLKRRIIILGCLIFSMTLIFQVKSYTMAKVENSANISITSSENALIAMPQIIEIKFNKHTTENVTNQLTALGEQEVEHTVLTQYEMVESNFEIQNNINQEVYIEAKLVDDINGINLINNIGRVSIRGFKNIKVSLDDDIQDIPESVDIVVKAEWIGGSADIESQVNLNVNNIDPVINVITLDLPTPDLNVAPLIDEINKNDEIDIDSEIEIKEVEESTDVEEINVEPQHEGFLVESNEDINMQENNNTDNIIKEYPSENSLDSVIDNQETNSEESL